MPGQHKKIQSAILQYAKHTPFVVAYNIVKASERGVPDILCCINGKFVGVEVKGDGDRLSASQTEQIKRINTANGTAYVVGSLNDFKKVMEQENL